jgi:hypothetical protein
MADAAGLPRRRPKGGEIMRHRRLRRHCGDPQDRVERALELMKRAAPTIRHTSPSPSRPERRFAALGSASSTSTAFQPAVPRRRALVFNGEVYNYAEVRPVLEEEGYSFRTTSDTEVLIKALGRWGWRSLERCEGMWAFALYNTDTGSLLLARDRFGEKPLYLYRDEAGLYFASEPKLIFAAGRRLPVNHEHLYRRHRLQVAVQGRTRSSRAWRNCCPRLLCRCPRAVGRRCGRTGSRAPRRDCMTAVEALACWCVRRC